jgi:hypothetical protein
MNPHGPFWELVLLLELAACDCADDQDCDYCLTNG